MSLPTLGYQKDRLPVQVPPSFNHGLAGESTAMLEAALWIDEEKRPSKKTKSEQPGV